MFAKYSFIELLTSFSFIYNRFSFVLHACIYVWYINIYSHKGRNFFCYYLSANTSIAQNYER